jgi:signal transduction histidine kinase
VSNAVRHAGAREIRFAMGADQERATLEVTDDGAGFDVAAAEAGRRGMGLFIMRERLGLVDGSLTIASAPGAGTRVRATVPMAPGRGRR